jgi:uncharacterized membrane protein YdbT with pleckstrin-like domain
VPWYAFRVADNEIVQAGPEGDAAGEQVFYDGHPALLPSAGHLALAVLTVGLALIYFWLKQKGSRYRITSERVVIERGIFSKRVDQIDVYRINDYTLELPFGQRMMGTGNLVLDAMDRSTPQLRLAGLNTDVRQLYEDLRKATEAQKRLRGVRVIDYE